MVKEFSGDAREGSRVKGEGREEGQGRSETTGLRKGAGEGLSSTARHRSPR